MTGGRTHCLSQSQAVSDRSKNAFPVRLSATSYILPADILPNPHCLQHPVDLMDRQLPSAARCTCWNGSSTPWWTDEPETSPEQERI
jgi:hypothetical protein